jgi:hypothetical protein
MKESKPRYMNDQERKSLQDFYKQVEASLAEINKQVEALKNKE